MKVRADRPFVMPVGPDGKVEPVSLPTGAHYTIVLDHVIEVLVVGEDEKPLRDVPVALRRSGNTELLARSEKNGLVRFGGLDPKRAYKLCLYMRDKDAWELEGLERVAGSAAVDAVDTDWIDILAGREVHAKTHPAQQGECISSIAESYGFFPETLWEYAANRELKKLRKDPSILMEGDLVAIPHLREKEEDVKIGNRYTVRTKGVPEKLIIQFDIGGEPRAGEGYVLDIDGTLSEGNTDSDGMLDIWIPPNAKKGKISFPDSGDEYELELGYLNPIEEISGVQARLANLGYDMDEVSGEMTNATRRALRMFQVENDLPETGEPDAATLRKLEEVYGG